MINPENIKKPTKAEAEPALTPEQAAIMASANRVESELSGQVLHDAEGNIIEQAEEDNSDPVEENRQILALLISLATPAMPFLEKCYTPEVIAGIAAAYSAVEEKYGWNIRQHMGCEVGLAIVAIPPTIAAVVLGRQHFAEKRAIAELEARAQGRTLAPDQPTDARSNAIGA